MKKYSLVIIVLTIISLTSTVFSFYYKQKHNEEVKNKAEKIIDIQGDSENWRIENGLFIVSRENQLFKGGVLKYKGNKELNCTSISIDVILKDKKNNEEISIYSVSEISQDSLRLFRLNKDYERQLGLVEGALIDSKIVASKIVASKIDYELTALIKYRTDSENITETIRLDTEQTDIIDFKQEGK